MLSHYFTQPITIEINDVSQLTFQLRENISDFVLLQLINAPMAEIIVSDAAANGVSLIVRHQPFLTVIAEPISANPGTVCLARTLGQGFRLYTRIGTSPSLSASILRKGISLCVRTGVQCLFALDGITNLDLTALERDTRIASEPKVILLAKSLLAREYDYMERTEMLAIHIAELEHVRADLREYLSSDVAGVHSVLTAEVIGLDAQMQKKRQWLMRAYSQSIERPSFARAANEETDLEQLQRLLDCYELLAPPSVSEMVKKLADENM